MKKILALLLAVSPLLATPTVRLSLPPPLQKAEIPSFTARDKDAKELFFLRDLKRAVNPNAERVALVYFATWCKPCIEGMVHLRNSKDLLEQNGVQIVLVNVGERDVNGEIDVKKVHRWIEKYSDPSWLLIMDVNRQLVRPYGLSPSGQDMVLPQTLLLSGKLKPLLLLGAEGSDWPQVLWEEIKQQ